MPKVHHSAAARVKANGIEIVYQGFGEPTAPPLLLVAGLSQQMIGWPEAFCTTLAARGYRVIRFDNRDAGLSTKFDQAGVPDLSTLARASVQRENVQAPYTLRDMADDAAGLLDALEIASAHVVGVSMGGMIAQEMAIRHPDRVRTLTSIMSSTGDPSLPPPTPEAMAVFSAPVPADRAGYIESCIRDWHVFNGPRFPLDEDYYRDLAAQYYDRGLCPDGTTRQLLGVYASGSRRETLKAVTTPTLVIHGDADPLVPVEGGIDTANSIPGAELMIIEGLGHNIPPPVAPQIIDAIARHAV